MTSKSTLVGKCILILTTITLSTFHLSNGQATSKKLKSIQPSLISGTDGEIGNTSLDGTANIHINKQNALNITNGSQIEGNRYSEAETTDKLNRWYFKTINNSLEKEPGVKYRSFAAYTLNNTTANFAWTTESESNNDHFEVERSFDQKDFKTIALVFGAEGNVTTSSHYSFNDDSKSISSHRIVYYRLKQIDFDGKVTYSPEQIVRFGADAETVVQISPNPYMGKINVNFESEESGKAEVRMINSMGQVVAARQSSIIKGYSEIQLANLDTQLAGIYIVDLLVNGKKINTRKVIKE